MEERLRNLIERFPLLWTTVQKLNENQITWMIAGSACLYVHGNERLPDDVDFYLPTHQHETANKAFNIESYLFESATEKVKNSNPEGDHSMQLTSELRITKDHGTYQLKPTALVIRSRTEIQVDGQTFYFAPIEEVLLIKAILNRGPEVGKQDAQDVQNFIKIHPDIQMPYLVERQAELGLSEDFFSKTVFAKLSPEQEKWIQHLSNDYAIKIVPFDPTAEEKFQKIKAIIQAKLGADIKVEHHGATSLGISGQDEIDVYVPVPPGKFNSLFAPLTELFEKSRSHYDMERARFKALVDGKKVDVFLTNEQHPNWIRAIKFENYLRTHPEALEEYRKLKESGDGSLPQDYYRKKGEFINEIVNRVQ